MSAVRGVTWALRNSYYDKRGLHALKLNWERTHERIWNIGPEQLVLPMG